MTDYLEEERIISVNVFGQTKYNPKTFKNEFIYNVDKDDLEEPVNNEINDLITRETKLGKSIFSTERAISAVSDPLSYLTKKKEDLLVIRNKLIDKYKEAYISNLDRYHDPEYAKKKTMQEVMSYKMQLMSDHNYLYPTQIKGDKIAVAAPKPTETK